MENRFLKSDECNQGQRGWIGEPFWRKIDAVSKVLDHPAYWYVTIGLLIFGTVLGVIAPYLD